MFAEERFLDSIGSRIASETGNSQDWHSHELPENCEVGLTNSFGWVEALVDCPGAQGLFTYRLPSDLSVQPGDIISVPFGTQQIGAIAIRLIDQPPADLDAAQIKAVETVVSQGFFPPTYWQLLTQVAQYYQVPLIQAIRVALPPGLLARSQRRLRLLAPTEAISLDDPWLNLPARQLLECLQASKTGDCAWRHLQRHVRGAYRGLRLLLQRGWVESYLAPPKSARPKRQQAASLTALAQTEATNLTPRQAEVLDVLKRYGGDLWSRDLIQRCRTSSSTLKALAEKGYITLEQREILRAATGPEIAADAPKSLTTAQKEALGAIAALNGFAEVLLHGITGSGKTEVYLQAIAPCLERGQSALVLVPEIGLTPQLTDRFRARFGDRVCVYHSALSDGERYDTWRQLLTDDPRIVIGTRSAVFAPLSRLGLIVLDEEHDGSFKQDQPPPCYHARTVARWCAQLQACPLILGSATPSLESWTSAIPNSEFQIPNSDSPSSPSSSPSPPSSHPKPLLLGDAQPTSSSPSPHTPHPLTQNSKLKTQNSPPTLYLSLPQRIHARPLPPVRVIDMRQELKNGNRSLFSRALQTALRQLPERGQQGLLFIHRRGHSTFVSCRSCGHVLECPHCDVSLTYHHSRETAQPLLRCHYCNHWAVHPSHCPACNSPYLKHFGSGTQRVMAELADYFPELRALRFDSDTTRGKQGHRRILTQFANGEADLLVGTQMLAKGIDLPQVTLVGVVSADGLLHLPDYRASERACQTLIQVIGRAGRGDEPGQAILQTYTPEHAAIEAVEQHDYAAFVEAEWQQRQALNYPPAGRAILLRLNSADPVLVRQTAERIGTALRAGETPHPELEVPAPVVKLAKQLQAANCELLGPAPASIPRVANRYRWQLLLKFPREQPSLPSAIALQEWCPSAVRLTIDVDPLNLL